VVSGQRCLHCGFPNNPDEVRCADCGEALHRPAAAAPAPGNPLGQTLIQHLPIILTGAVILLGLLAHACSSPPDQITETVTVAQVETHPDAFVRYPRGVQVATVAVTGTTTLHADYAEDWCGTSRRTWCRKITGYSSIDVTGGRVARLFTTSDNLSQVLAWYRRELTRRGWTVPVAGSSSGLSLTLFTRSSGLPGSRQPEEFTIYTGDPQWVSSFGGGSWSRSSRARTLFATRYTLYPVGTKQY